MNPSGDPATAILGLLRDERIVDLDPRFGPDDDLFAAGLDSMAVMQLLVAIGEHWDIHLAAADVTREHFATASALGRLVEARSGPGREA